jgi:hypothetical protein
MFYLDGVVSRKFHMFESSDTNLKMNVDGCGRKNFSSFHFNFNC